MPDAQEYYTRLPKMAICPRCGRRDYCRDGAGYAVCLTCGYYAGSDRGAGVIAPRGNGTTGAGRIRRELRAAGVACFARIYDVADTDAETAGDE